MAVELNWIANRSLSCLHAASALAAGQSLVNADLSAKLANSTQSLKQKLAACGVPADVFWSHVAPLSASLEANRELAKVALTKTIGAGRVSDPLVAAVGLLLTEIKRIYADALPDVLDELALRSGPLREQWEARGPGLLAGVGRRTEGELIVERADVFPAYPVLGGSGTAHLAYNSVRIEAVLANTVAELPEVVRLGWLLAQLNIDLPKYSEDLPRDRVPLVAGWAVLPSVLEAAADVELVRPTPELIGTALAAWNVGTGSLDRPKLAEAIARWWQTYQESRPPWRVALVALNKMAQ